MAPRTFGEALGSLLLLLTVVVSAGVLVAREIGWSPLTGAVAALAVLFIAARTGAGVRDG